MSAAQQRPGVLVVGAGPVGLTATIELLRRGVAVRCVDRASGPGELSKALGLWPRTIEIMTETGGRDLLDRLSLAQEGMRYYSSGRRVCDIGYHPHTRPLISPQPVVERVMRANLERLGGRIDWNVTVTGIDQDENQDSVLVRLRRPDGTESAERYAWVVGADGAGSTVRAEIGAEFTGSTYPMRFLVADVAVDTALPADRTHYFCSPAGILVVCGLPSGRWRVFTSAPEGAQEEKLGLTEVQDLVDLRGPGGITVSDPDWISVFSVHARQAERVRSGRVFLAGDAAHIHSPAGGQGLNIGVGDAHNLAWKLAAVWNGQMGPAVLDTYQPERAQVARSVVRQADRQTRMWMLARPGQMALRDGLLRAASALRLFDVSYVPGLAGLRTVYRARPEAGRRRGRVMPGALVPGAVRERLTGEQHTLVIGVPTAAGELARIDPLTGDGPRLVGLLDRCRREFGHCVDVLVVDDRQLGAAVRWGTRRELLVLVRPDGHVDTVVQDTAALESRLTHLFRPRPELIDQHHPYEEKVS